MSESLIRLDVVMARTSLSRSEIYRRMNAGDFPRPVQLSPRRVGFIKSEIDAFIDHQIALRDQPNGE